MELGDLGWEAHGDWRQARLVLDGELRVRTGQSMWLLRPDADGVSGDVSGLRRALPGRRTDLGLGGAEVVDLVHTSGSSIAEVARRMDLSDCRKGMGTPSQGRFRPSERSINTRWRSTADVAGSIEVVNMLLLARPDCLASSFGSIPARRMAAAGSRAAGCGRC